MFNHFVLLPVLFLAILAPIPLSAAEPATPLVVRVNHRARNEKAKPAPSTAMEDAAAIRNKRRISEAFEEIEAARFGKKLEIPENNEAYEAKFAPMRGPLKPKAKGECSTLSVQEKLGPVRSQADMGWCFAVVASDLLSVELGYRVSHLDLGLRYFRVSPQNRKEDRNGETLSEDPSVTQFWAGNLERAVEIGVTGGVCSEKDIPSNDMMYSVLSSPSHASLIDIKDSRFLTSRVLRMIELSVGRSLSDMATDQDDTCESVFSAQLQFPKLDTFQIISTLSSARTREEAMNWLVTQACDRKPVALPPKWKLMAAVAQSKSNSPAADLLPGIDGLLELGKPAAIAFDAKRFHAGAAANPAVIKAPHSALIVKRAFRNGSCQYLVRDSQGPSCNGFAPPYNDRAHCERGHYWVTEKELDQTLTGITGAP